MYFILCKVYLDVLYFKYDLATGKKRGGFPTKNVISHKVIRSILNDERWSCQLVHLHTENQQHLYTEK